MEQHHHVALSRPGTRLFADHREACSLWERLVGQVPGLVALCLMPDHVHLQSRQDARVALGQVMADYAQSRNRLRGQTGAVWWGQRAPQVLVDRDKIRRSVRYIHLNPCRKKPLVGDPLSWPWSTHRDACGLALTPAVARRGDPYAFHAYVSGDPSVSVDGTLLPAHGPDGHEAWPDLLEEALGALGRTPPSRFRRRGPARRALVRLLRAETALTPAEIALRCGVSARTVRRASDRSETWMRQVGRVAGDPRFGSLACLDAAISRYQPWRGQGSEAPWRAR